MIKANELRIGNLIHIGWDDVEVTAIEEDGTLDTTAYFDGFKGCCGCMDSEATPIPLTKEWLERMGFEKDEYQPGRWDDPHSFETLFPVIIQDGENFYLDLESCMVGRPFRYVHQLQNIFFAITGEELIIKP